MNFSAILVPVLFSTIGSLVGQLLLKMGMSRMGSVSLAGGSLPKLIFSIATNWRVVGGLGIYGLGVYFWLIALSRAQLSYVYPFASLGYVLITIASFVILREKITLLRVLGVVTICAGVLIVSFS